MAHSSWGGPGLSRNNLTRILGVPGIPLYVHSEVGLIHQHLANHLKNLRQAKAPALNSSGGYVKRYIAGTTRWSNHSWGLAVDYNAPTNPYSHKGTTDFRVDETRALVRSLEGLRWGWDYSGKKDAMHFEWIASRESARKMTSKLQGGGSPVSSGAFTIGSKGDKIRELELKLKMIGFGGFTVDDRFDERTKDSVLAFQKKAFPGQPKEWDGIVGAKTLKELEFWPLNLPVSLRHNYVRELPALNQLLPGQRLISADSKHSLVLQPDGNLVLYSAGNPTWATGVRGNRAVMQADGNFVLYLSDGITTVPVWHTNTAKKAGSSRLVLQDDGNLVMYGQVAVWNTKTVL